MQTSLEIGRRFNGPPNTGNGGYSAGLLLEALGGASDPVTVTLKAPPPLDRPLILESDAEGSRLMDGDAVIAQAGPGHFDHPVMDVPDHMGVDPRQRLDERVESFETCFVCGSARHIPDGLCIYAYARSEDKTDGIIAPWSLHQGLSDDGRTVALRFLASALDCPGYFACAPGEPALLARFTVQQLRPLPADGECVVLGWPTAPVDGRKRGCGTLVVGPDRQLVARAEALWILVPAVYLDQIGGAAS